MEEASVKFDRSHLHEVALHISKQAEILLTSTHPNRDINLDKYGFSLILCIYEQFNASLTLLNSHNPQYSGAIIRGMQECLVNLKCLVKDPLFINNLFHDDAVANKQAIEASLKISADDSEATTYFQAKLAEELSIIKTHKDNGIKTQTKFIDRFEKVGMLTDYQTTYKILSGVAHSSPTVLIARHWRQGKFVFNNPLTDRIFYSFHLMNVTMLTDAFYHLVDFAPVPQREVDHFILNSDLQIKSFLME